MANKFLKKTIPMIKRDFPTDKAEKIVKEAKANFDELCRLHDDESKALKKHTHNQIYCILAIQKAMESNGISREDATSYLTDRMAERCNTMSPKLQKIMKFADIWKKVPTIFSKVVPKMFGPDAGFEAEYLITTKERSKFDMKKCPYATIFKREGYPELCKICCMSDDLTYGKLSPEHLGWGRTKTIGRGDDVCDFDIFYLDGK